MFNIRSAEIRFSLIILGLMQVGDQQLKHLTTSRSHATESDWSPPPESAVLQHLKQTLAEAFAAPASAYVEMTADAIIVRNRKN
ncbi:hypothetical protein HGI47_00240 [Novosphingobium sp. ERN07]|nr:hypothetical protein [Novosphingobium sp. ERN07]